MKKFNWKHSLSVIAGIVAYLTTIVLAIPDFNIKIGSTDLATLLPLIATGIGMVLGTNTTKNIYENYQSKKDSEPAVLQEKQKSVLDEKKK